MGGALAALCTSGGRLELEEGAVATTLGTPATEVMAGFGRACEQSEQRGCVER